MKDFHSKVGLVSPTSKNPLVALRSPTQDATLNIDYQYEIQARLMKIINKILNSANLDGKDFDDHIFESCKFTGDIKFVNFNNCNFVDCDLTGAIFNITSFSKCTFSGSKLSNIDFRDIRIQNCDFSNSVMENCIFQKIIVKNEVKKLDLRNCIFNNTNLKSSAFIFCNLAKVSFEKSDLSSVIFERCNLIESNLAEAIIDGAGFETSYIDKTILDISGFVSFGNSKGFILHN